MNSYIFTGRLMHSRTTPVRNTFVYPVFNLLLDLDDLPALNRLPIFGYNRFSLVSVDSRDHLGDARRDIQMNIRNYLADHDIVLDGGRILLLTNPRIFGYVFNPVSFFYCYDARGELNCVVAEVHNTFGERSAYLLNAACALPVEQGRRYQVDKNFYVSPFIAMDARYEFIFSPIAAQMSVHTNEFRAGQKFFQARLWGECEPLTTRALCARLWRLPLMTLQVIGLIHWQAIKLWRHGVPVQPRPNTRMRI